MRLLCPTIFPMYKPDTCVASLTGSKGNQMHRWHGFFARIMILFMGVFWFSMLVAIFGSPPSTAYAALPVACASNVADPSPMAHSFPGHVVALAAAEQIAVRTHAVELRTGWLVSEEYSNWPRIIAEVDEGHGHIIKTLAAHSPRYNVAVGEAVVVVSRHRDPRHSCRFIPWTVKPTDAVT